MKPMIPRPGVRPRSQYGPIQDARRNVETFVATEGATWTVLYIIAGIALVGFLVVILNATSGAFF